MRNTNSKGLTLGELLLGVAILSFVLCGLIVLFINCSLLVESSRNLSSAVMHAQYVLEEIRDTDFSGLETAVSAGSWDWDVAEIEAGGMTALHSELIDSSVFQSGDPLGVAVTVTWKDRGRRDRSTELRSIFTDY